jgi:hypothetical protein
VEGELEEVVEVSLDVEHGANVAAEERKVKREAGAEENRVELFGGTVFEADLASIHLGDPWLDVNAAFGDERQKMLREGYAGLEDIFGRFASAVVLGAAAVRDDKVLEQPSDVFHGEGFGSKCAEACEANVFGGSAGDELEEDISLLAAAGDDT